MKRILLTSAGGAPATNFARSLRRSGEPFWIVGIDANPFTLERAETDERYLVPRAKDPAYLPVLRDIIKETGAEFLHCQMSYEMLTVSKLRDELGLHTFLPSHRAIDICENKFESFRVWQENGIPVPATMLLEKPEDLERAFRDLGPRLWLREIRGSAGKGSLPTDDPDTARRWVDFRKGWGNFTAAECLEPQTITWQSIWRDGELIVAQGRKRLYWEFADRAPSGVTGITGTGVTVSDPVVDDISRRAVLAVDTKASGVFGVDMTYAADGTPRVTEINIGRFFTTHLFFTAAGLNMPYIYTKLAFGEDVHLPARRLNPLTPGLAWIRGMDCEPILKPMSEIELSRTVLSERLKRLGEQ